MFVFGTGIHVEVAEQLIAQTIFGQHAFYHFAEEAIFTLGLEACGGCLALSTGVAGVAQIDAIVPLVAGQNDFVGINHDDIVSAIHVRSEVGFVLAPEQLGDLGAQASQRLAVCIDDHPFLVYGCFVRRNGLVT